MGIPGMNLDPVNLHDVHKERDFYRGLFESATDLIIVVDTTQGAAIRNNHAMREALGYDEDALREVAWRELFAPEDADKVFTHCSSPQECSALVPMTLRTRDGELIPVEVAIVRPSPSDSRLCALICRDVTQRCRHEEALLQAKETAERSNRLKSVFLASMSHELRTPMNAILGFSELLCEELKNSPQHRMAEIINSSGHRLLDTLNSILDLSLIEADRMEVIRERVDVVTLAEEVCLLFKPLARRKGIRLECICEETGIPAWTDPQLLRQMINNLLSNAIKFTTQGYVHLILREEMVESLQVIRIDVVDTGIGISEENQILIFEEYRQASEGYGRRFEGSGLGLAITQKFAELLGGRIRVQSTPGMGSRFSVLLPLSAPAS